MAALFLLLVLFEILHILPYSSVLAEPLPFVILGTPVNNVRPSPTYITIVGTPIFNTALHNHLAVATAPSNHLPSKAATMDDDGDGSLFPLDSSETKPSTKTDSQNAKNVNVAVILAICAAVLLVALFGVGLALIRMRRSKRRDRARKHQIDDFNETGLTPMSAIASNRAVEHESNTAAARGTTHEEPPPPYLPSPPETAHEQDHPILQGFLNGGLHDHSFEIDFNSPSFMTSSITTFTPLEEQMRANSLSGRSEWTDCSVTEPSSARTSFISQVPLPAHAFVTAKRLSLANQTRLSHGYVGNQVRRLNSTASKLSLTPIQPTPYLQPEILSPKETTKTLQFRGGFYTHVN